MPSWIPLHTTRIFSVWNRTGGGEQVEDEHIIYNLYADDTYYPEHDPLGNLMSALQAAGQSFSSKIASLMSDEVTKTRKTASDLEEAIQQGYMQASAALSQAMEVTKKDMQALSQEALATLSAAVVHQTKHYEDNQEQPDGDNKQTKPQTVSRKGLFDAASALSSLTKTWHEAVASMTAQEDATTKNEE
jgi:hypothetical protein